MSRPEADRGAGASAALKRLDQAVADAVSQVGDLRGRVQAAEARSKELEGLLQRFDAGGENPGDYVERVHVLEAENVDLRARIHEGREAVERLLSRIRFLEEQR